MSDDDRVALRALRLDWNGDRTERLLAGVHRRLSWRRRAWRAVAVSVVVAGGVGASLLVLQSRRGSDDTTATVSRFSIPQAERVIRLAEGSEIRLEGGRSEVRVTEESSSQVRVELVQGSSRYTVVPKRDRTFEVRAGTVTVTVVGTEFAVERRRDAVWVNVTRGKVRVRWGNGDDGRALLGAGESGLFPPLSGTGSGPTMTLTRDATESPSRRIPRAAQSYRSQVARRDYSGAYAALSRDPALAGDTVEDLLVAADVARLSDHPAQALPYLQRILRDHARDERAPMAAFTLGRTLSGLGRTRQAMELFARVHTAWPGGSLAEDALVREAEAASTLGDTARAVRLAEQYDRDHPRGGRRAEIRRYAHLTPVAPLAPVAPLE